MKNKKLWLIILLTLLVGIILATIGVMSGAQRSIIFGTDGIKIASSKTQLILTKEDNLEAFENIDIDFDSVDVEVQTGDSYGIEIETNDKESIKWENKDGKLTIKQNRILLFNLMFDFNLKKDIVKIYVPKDVKLETLNTDILSGSFKVTDISSKDLLLKQTSGTTDINNSISDNIDIKITSGKVNIYNSKYNKSKLKATSGKIYAENSNFNDLDSKITTGVVDLSGSITGNTVLKVISGTILLRINGQENDYSKKIKMLSGNVNINGISMANDFVQQLQTNNKLDIEVETGIIKIDFVN